MDRVRNSRDSWVESPETVERERRAVEMRAGGATYREIGDELGVSPSSAFRMVKRALDRVPAERRWKGSPVPAAGALRGALEAVGGRP